MHGYLKKKKKKKKNLYNSKQDNKQYEMETI